MGARCFCEVHASPFATLSLGLWVERRASFSARFPGAECRGTILVDIALNRCGPWREVTFALGSPWRWLDAETSGSGRTHASPSDGRPGLESHLYGGSTPARTTFVKCAFVFRRCWSSRGLPRVSLRTRQGPIRMRRRASPRTQSRRAALLRGRTHPLLPGHRTKTSPSPPTAWLVRQTNPTIPSRAPSFLPPQTAEWGVNPTP
jgi:hypothetical protein